MPSCCWITDAASLSGEKIHPLEAFVLSLCTGQSSFEDIVYIVQQVLEKSSEWSERLASRVLEKRNRFLKFFSAASTRDKRYDPADFLYRLEPTARSGEGRLDSPAELTLILTHLCNFKCIYCFNSSSPLRRSEMMTDDWLRLLGQAKQQGVLKCTVSGGEPMTHPGFRKILATIVDYGMLPYLCTNGSLVRRSDVHFFKEIGLPCIQISLDSAAEEIHDRMSMTPTSFPAIREGIGMLVEAGIDVFIKGVITPINFSGLQQLIDSCHDWGVKKLVLDRFDLSNAGRGDEGLFLSRSMEEEMGRITAERQEFYRGDDFTVFAVDTPRCWKEEKDIVVCGALSASMTILPDGQVSVCEKLVEHPLLTVGNVTRQSLEEIWNDPAAWRVLRPDQERVDSICTDCALFAKCHTGCFAQTLVVTDNPYAPDPRCWQAAYDRNPYAVYARQEARSE
jgi:pyrroloquinoline quinone biosynthesis protein E